MKETYKDIANNLVLEFGSKELVVKALTYGRAKTMTDNMFQYITDEQKDLKLEFYENVLVELRKM